MEAWIAEGAQRIAARAGEELERFVAVSSPSGDVEGAEAAFAVAISLAPGGVRMERAPCSSPGHADAIPGLEILANDVRCTHAAAIAQIDPEQLYYLRSRGLSLERAKRLVIEGFLEATVERFEQGFVRQAVAGALERRLEAVLG